MGADAGERAGTERRQRVLVLQPAELALDSRAAAVPLKIGHPEILGKLF